MSEELKPIELLRKLIEEHGDQVGYDEPVCITWKADHQDCVGCPAHLGCAKLSALGLSMVTFSAYQPKNFLDFQDSLRESKKVADKILASKTVEEVYSVI